MNEGRTNQVRQRKSLAQRDELVRPIKGGGSCEVHETKLLVGVVLGNIRKDKNRK